MWQRKIYLEKLNRTLVNPIAKQSFLKYICKGLLATFKLPWEIPYGCSWVSIYTISTFLCVAIDWQNISFFTFNRSVSNSQFLLSNICLQCYQQKNKKKTWRKLIRLHIKTRSPAQWCNETNIEMHTRQADLFNLISHWLFIRIFTGINEFNRSWNYT